MRSMLAATFAAALAVSCGRLEASQTLPKVATSQKLAADASTPVGRYGRLSVINGQLSDQSGQPVQLRGVSTHGLQWFAPLYNQSSFQWLKDDWGAQIVRLAMYTAQDGYLSHPDTTKAQVRQLVDAAVTAGIYVIVDWHILYDNDPTQNWAAAKAFFEEMAQTYAQTPNVIWEICNEPNGGTTWDGSIKPYATDIVSAIRQYSTGIVVVGTPEWSSRPDYAAAEPIPGFNIMYSFHFYAGTHRQDYRDRVSAALSKHVPIMITEWGASDASGGGGPYFDEASVWTNFMRQKNISWTSWSLSTTGESSAMLEPGASPTGGWQLQNLTPEGQFVRGMMK